MCTLSTMLRWRRAALGVVTMGVIWGAIPAAWAGDPPADPEVFYPFPLVKVWADLDFVRERNASICPGEQWMRDMMGAPMGSETFKSNPRGVYVGRVRVVLSRASGGFAAAYVWVDAKGVEHHARYTQRGDTWFHCREAMEFLVTDLSVHFSGIEIELGEKYAATTPPPYCPAAPSPSPKSETITPQPCQDSRYSIWPPEWPLPPLPKPTPDPPKSLDNWPIAIRVSAATWTELIASGSGSLGFSGGIGARYHAVSLDAEVHGDPSLGAQPFVNGSVSFTRISGDLLLCAHLSWFAGCGVGEAGRIFFPNRISPMPPSTSYVAAGLRTELNFPIAPPWVFLSTSFDLLAPIHPANYSEMGRSIFQVSGPSVGLGLGLRVELPL